MRNTFEIVDEIEGQILEFCPNCRETADLFCEEHTIYLKGAAYALGLVEEEQQ